MSIAKVVSIHVAPAASETMQSVQRVQAEAGKGLVGDRYFRDEGNGTFFEPRKSGQDLTLIESEALTALFEESNIKLLPGETRRNVVTAGIALNDLVGRRFFVGPVECLGDRLCDPCSHLQKVTYPGVRRGLFDRGGLRADIMTSGRISVGDKITVPAQ